MGPQTRDQIFFSPRMAEKEKTKPAQLEKSVFRFSKRTSQCNSVQLLRNRACYLNIRH